MPLVVVERHCLSVLAEHQGWAAAEEDSKEGDEAEEAFMVVMVCTKYLAQNSPSGY
jgi:hypothetical protein